MVQQDVFRNDREGLREVESQWRDDRGSSGNSWMERGSGQRGIPYEEQAGSARGEELGQFRGQPAGGNQPQRGGEWGLGEGQGTQFGGSRHYGEQQRGNGGYGYGSIERERREGQYGRGGQYGGQIGRSYGAQYTGEFGGSTGRGAYGEYGAQRPTNQGYGAEMQRPWRGQGWDGGEGGQVRPQASGGPVRYSSQYSGSYGGGETGGGSGREWYGSGGEYGSQRGMPQGYDRESQRSWRGQGWEPGLSTPYGSQPGSQYGSGGMYGRESYGSMGSSSQFERSSVGSWVTGGASSVRSQQRRGPKGYTRSDERIREDICDRLMQMDDLDSSDIEVHVHDGEIKLSGTVSDRRCKYRVEELADSISGVKEVSNNLRIKREPESDTGSGGYGSGASERSSSTQSSSSSATSGGVESSSVSSSRPSSHSR